MSSPWGRVPEIKTENLTDIMSEELARELQEKEYATASNWPHVCGRNYEQDASCAEIEQDEQCKSDIEIATLLQQQYDKEYDQILKHTENKYNGSNKVSVSFSNYRRTPLNADFESDVEEEEEQDDKKKDWDRFDGVQRDYKSMPACGYVKKSGSMITKHDTELNGRRNTCKMMSFPPDFETGDGAGFDMQLSNKVFNCLRMHSKHENSRRRRLRDKREDQATAEFGLDERTRLLLYKMINNQLLEHVNGIISIGKEAVVLHADSDPNYAGSGPELPKECVLKVFKTTLSEYKQRDKYIKDDHRFRDRMGKHTNKRVVHLWAEKEMRNLNRLRKAGIAAPLPITLKQHVLVMSFIGDDHKPAPKLKYADMSDAERIVAYAEVVDAMKALYTNANLIHADLSEYNILWHANKCYIIDVSQSVEPSHENAFHFLLRDCTNIHNFFEKLGVPDVQTPEMLFKSIVGCEFTDKVGLLEQQANFKMKPHLVDRPDLDLNYRFDNAWKRSEIARTHNTESDGSAGACSKETCCTQVQL